MGYLVRQPTHTSGRGWADFFRHELSVWGSEGRVPSVVVSVGHGLVFVTVF